MPMALSLASDSVAEDSEDSSLCRVCSNPASGIHYGIVACNSCKVHHTIESLSWDKNLFV